MDTQKIINRVVGTEGTLRIPSWWMHKILSDLVKYCEKNEGASVTIKEYVESQLNLVGKTIEDLDTRLENIESHELFEIVSELPSEPKDNTIYLIPSQNGEGNNVLAEWVHINGTWEQFGEFNANVDLSEYAKKEALDELSEEIKNQLSELEIEVSEKLESKVVASTEPTEDMQFGYDDSEIREELVKLHVKMQRMYEELKAMIQGGATTPPYAVLDNAILDQVILL